MLLRLIPILAVALTLISLVASSGWRPDPQDGLAAPAHASRY